MAAPQDGLLLLDKAAGGTSHDLVAACRRILRQKEIGHCGTLDPDATGLMLLVLGKATRLTRFLIEAPKTYLGKARFGVATDTYDTSGAILEEKPTAGLEPEKIAEAMETFQGTVMHTIPPYSAKKIGGRKYYELARKGEKTPDEKKEVTVFEFSAPEPWAAGQDLAFRLSCGTGTYARSLVHELGQKLGCGAALSELRRTRVGFFRLEDAITLETLRARIAAEEPLGPAFIAFDEIPLPFGNVAADSQQERRILQGQTVLFRDLEGREGDWIKVLNPNQRMIAVGTIVERIGGGNVGVLQPKVVFN
jgi:tRNA pseudouridine55 synthase